MTTPEPKRIALYRQSAGSSLKNILKWRETIISVGGGLGVDYGAELIAAIISRETNGLLKFCLPPPEGKLGDGGYGHGPMQIDKRSFPEWCADWAAGKLTVDDGIEMGGKVLATKMSECAAKLSDGGINLLHASIAAYNCGTTGVLKSLEKGRGIDGRTTGKDYGIDVLTRRGYFVETGKFEG